MPNKNLLRFLQCVLERVAASCGVVVLYNKKVDCEKNLRVIIISKVISYVKTNFAKLISIIFENFDWLILKLISYIWLLDGKRSSKHIIIFFLIRFYVVTIELSML